MDEIVTIYLEKDGKLSEVAFSLKKEFEFLILQWTAEEHDRTIDWNHVHNPYGPAWTQFGGFYADQYILNGCKVSKEEQEKYLKQMLFKHSFNDLLQQ